MPEEYLIITLTEQTIKSGKAFESGAEQKYKIPWTQVDADLEQLAVFKIDNEPSQISRVWIEKLAGELAVAMGLPTATYEMCKTDDNRRGIASPSYLRNGAVEQPGIALMQEVFETNSVLYTVENALTVFDRLDISLPSSYTSPSEIGTAKDLFIGYLLHSYWIDDPDFHNRNWGIQTNPNGERELLPNYDYGRALVDFPIINNRLEIFAERLAGTRTCAFVNNDGKEIKMDEMVAILKRISPATTQYWSERIAQASAERLNPICDLFPFGWMSPDRMDFARVFINYNSRRLEQLTKAPSQIVLEVEDSTTINYPDDSSEPPNDSLEPPLNPRTPPSSPNAANSPDTPNSTDSPPISTNTNRSPRTTNISMDRLNKNRDAKDYYNQAILKAYKLNDITGALADFDKSIFLARDYTNELNSQSANAYYHRAVLKQIKLDDINGALNDYDRAIKLNPQFINAYYNRGVLKQTRLDDIFGALADYDRAIELNSQFADVYYSRAILKETKLDDIFGAFTDYNRAIKLNPQFTDAYYRQAILKVSINHISGALIDYDKVIELNPQDSNAYHHRANLKQTKLNDISGALIDYNKTIELNPQDIDARLNRAILKQFSLNDVSGALIDYNKAIEINPQYASAYYNLASLKSSRLNDVYGALIDYNKAIEINPQYASAYEGRAILKQAKFNDLHGSVEDLKRAATLYQQQGNVEDWQDIIDRLKKLENAI
jgi:tetratricopeptide (TPR) repeat protein